MAEDSGVNGVVTGEVDVFPENTTFSPEARNMPPPPARAAGFAGFFASEDWPFSVARFEDEIVREDTGVKIAAMGWLSLGERGTDVGCCFPSTISIGTRLRRGEELEETALEQIQR